MRGAAFDKVADPLQPASINGHWAVGCAFWRQAPRPDSCTRQALVNTPLPSHQSIQRPHSAPNTPPSSSSQA